MKLLLQDRTALDQTDLEISLRSLRASVQLFSLLAQTRDQSTKGQTRDLIRVQTRDPTSVVMIEPSVCLSDLYTASEELTTRENTFK